MDISFFEVVIAGIAIIAIKKRFFYSTLPDFWIQWGDGI